MRRLFCFITMLIMVLSPAAVPLHAEANSINFDSLTLGDGPIISTPEFTFGVTFTGGYVATATAPVTAPYVLQNSAPFLQAVFTPMPADLVTFHLLNLDSSRAPFQVTALDSGGHILDVSRLALDGGSQARVTLMAEGIASLEVAKLDGDLALLALDNFAWFSPLSLAQYIKTPIPKAAAAANRAETAAMRAEKAAEEVCAAVCYQTAALLLDPVTAATQISLAALTEGAPIEASPSAYAVDDVTAIDIIWESLAMQAQAFRDKSEAAADRAEAAAAKAEACLMKRTHTPLPGTVILLGSGLGLLGWFRARRR